MSVTPTFAGEMQLAGWSETHTGGCKVTFWLESSEDLDAFRALTVRKGNTAGHRFMTALVEIGDDEQPVQYPPGAVIPADEKLKPTLGPIAYWLVHRCKEPEFRSWLTESGDFANGPLNERQCRDVICLWCEVSSRKEIDNDPDATARFERFIRQPYLAHQRGKVIA